MTATMQRRIKRACKPVVPISDPKSLSGERLRLSPAQLERHPRNRKPTEAAIADLASSMASPLGQIERVLVRVLRAADEFQSVPTYQIVSGETRTLAARRLNWDSIDCEVVELDDAEALRVLAAANAARQDLDPIAQAKLIVCLCEPVESGGGGMTREQAAAMFEMKSGGGASNLVRLLELPEVWQDRVASGELPQSYARELLPLLDLGEQSGAWTNLEKEWGDRENKRGYGAFESRSKLSSEVEVLLENYSRPVESKDKRRYQAEGLGWDSHPMRFRLTADLEEQLRIVTLTIDEVPIRRATNCELYDQHQVPAIKAWLAKKNKGKVGRDEDGPRSEAKLTPKQQEAEDAARKEKAAEVLAKRIELWRAAWLRELVAEAITHDVHADLAIRICLWQQIHIRKVSYGDANNLSIDSVLADLFGVKGDPWRGVVIGKGVGGCPGAIVAHWLRCPARDGYPHPMPDDYVEDLIELLKIDLGGRWDLLQSTTGVDRERYQEFFTLHNCEQLDVLGQELQVGTAGAKNKLAKVTMLLNAPKTLKLPKSLRPLRGKRKGA